MSNPTTNSPDSDPNGGVAVLAKLAPLALFSLVGLSLFRGIGHALQSLGRNVGPTLPLGSKMGVAQAAKLTR